MQRAAVYFRFEGVQLLTVYTVLGIAFFLASWVVRLGSPRLVGDG